MKSQLRATAILASSSFVTVVVGLVSSKVWALLVGPTGVGLFGLMQSLVGIGGIVAGLGIGTGLVRLGAQAVGQGERSRVEALRLSTNRLSLVLGATAVLGFWLLRRTLGERVLGGAGHAGDVVLVGAAVCLTLVWTARISILNAYRRVGGLARFAVAHSLLGAAAGLGALWFLRERGIAVAVLATAATGVLVAAYMVRRELAGEPRVRPSSGELWGATRDLLRFGVPYSASSLVGYGVSMAVPIVLVLLHLVSTEEIGYFRASLSLSAGYFGFLLAAMAKDYYPRISAVSSNAPEMIGLVNQQLRLVTLIGAPIVVVGQVLSAQVVPLLYSGAFLPAAAILEWQLAAQLFVLWSWSLGFVLLARGRSGAFLLSESIGGTLLIGSTCLGVVRFGLPGAGIGYLFAYALYVCVVWALARREIGLVIETRNLRLFAAAVAASLSIKAVMSLHPGPVAAVVGGVIAAGVVAASAASLWGHLRPTSLPAVDVARSGAFTGWPRRG